MNNRIEIGHLAPFWGDDFKKLKYTKQGVTEEEIKAWEKQGYSENYVKSFTGSLYDSTNVMPEWVDRMTNLFGMHKQTYTVYRMETCEIMPSHSDHFRTYCRLNDTTPDKVNRVVLMLEDWKPGHYFEINGVGVVNWKAGDYFRWQGDIPHAASNIGTQPRYTLQITGLPIAAGQLNDFYAFNIPGFLDTEGHPFMYREVAPKINKSNDENYRYMVYMDNGFINQLNDVTHDDATIDLLNKDGVHIYLYEPICSYHKNAQESLYAPYTKHNQGFYSEFDYDIKPEDLRAEELDSILDYATRNRLTNVTVHTGDYDIDKWYPYYSEKLTLVCDDLFLKCQKKISYLNYEFSPQFHKTFVCLNWRYTKHRQLTATYLAGENGYLSWHHSAEFDSVLQNCPFKLESWNLLYPDLYKRLQEKTQWVNDHGPFSVDIKSTTCTHVTNPWAVDIWPKVPEYDPGNTPALYNTMSNNLASVYRDSFVDIITETRFGQPTANFSEKVFQAIQYQKPFIVVGPPKTLEYIRSLGFKTFDGYWDESYDEYYHHGERLAKIFQLINTLADMPLTEQRQLYDDMYPVIQHNLNRFKEFIEQ